MMGLTLVQEEAQSTMASVVVGNPPKVLIYGHYSNPPKNDMGRLVDGRDGYKHIFRGKDFKPPHWAILVPKSLN